MKHLKRYNLIFNSVDLDVGDGVSRGETPVGARLDDRRFAVAAVGKSHGRVERGREGGRRVTGSIGLTWIEYVLNIKIYSQKY